MKQKAENVEQEENTCAVQVREESFIVHDRQLMGGDIADDVRYADDDQEQRIHKRRHDEQRCPGGGGEVWLAIFRKIQFGSVQFYCSFAIKKC